MYYMTKGPHVGDELLCQVCGHRKDKHVCCGSDFCFCEDCAYYDDPERTLKDRTPAFSPDSVCEHDFVLWEPEAGTCPTCGVKH